MCPLSICRRSGACCFLRSPAPLVQLGPLQGRFGYTFADCNHQRLRLQNTGNQRAESGADMLPALLFASSSKEEGAQRLDAVARHRHCAQRKRHGSPSGAALQLNQHAGQGNRVSKGRLLATAPHPNLARHVKSICCSIKPFYGREKRM